MACCVDSVFSAVWSCAMWERFSRIRVWAFDSAAGGVGGRGGGEDDDWEGGDGAGGVCWGDCMMSLGRHGRVACLERMVWAHGVVEMVRCMHCWSIVDFVDCFLNLCSNYISCVGHVYNPFSIQQCRSR